MFLKLSQKAFSLAELMIVISIIGIVSAVSISSLTALQKNNRDAQRQADLRSIQGALQQYYADANHYPDTLVLTAGTAFTCPAGTCGTAAKTYMSKTPFDPTSGTITPYCYAAYKAPPSTACSAGQCHYYVLNTKLEAPSDTNTYSCGGQTNSYNFQVTPL